MINMYDDIQSAQNRSEQVAVVTIVEITDSSPCLARRRGLGHLEGRVGVRWQSAVGPPMSARRAGNTQGWRAARYTAVADTGETSGNCGGPMEVFVEAVRPEHRPILVGGYVPQELARFAGLLDFRLLVVDDRPDIANPQTFPEGTQPHCGDILLGVLVSAASNMRWRHDGGDHEPTLCAAYSYTPPLTDLG